MNESKQAREATSKLENQSKQASQAKQAKQGENIHSLSLKNITNNGMSHDGHRVSMASALALVFSIVT
jgi:hypothetical protein